MTSTTYLEEALEASGVGRSKVLEVSVIRCPDAGENGFRDPVSPLA